MKKILLSILFFTLVGVLRAEESVPLQGCAYPAEAERENRLCLLENEPVPLQFCLYGNRDKIRTPRITIYAARGIEILPGAFHCGYTWCSEKKGYEWRTDPPGVTVPDKIEKFAVERDGKNYNRWVLSLNEELLRKYLPTGLLFTNPTLLTVFFEAADGAEKTSALYWQLSTDEFRTEEKELRVDILPPLKAGKKPARIKLGFYLLDTLGCPDRGTWEKLFTLYNDKLGIRRGLARKYRERTDTDTKLSGRGWELLVEPDSWGGWAGGYWGVHHTDRIAGISGDDRITLKNGKKSARPRALCQTYMIKDGNNEGPWFNEARAHIEGSYFKGMKGFINDFEVDWNEEISPKNSCFCPRCLKAFTKFSGLETTGLTPEEILSRHEKQWYEFRAWQNGQMMKIFTRMVKTIDPNLKSVVYGVPPGLFSWPLDPRTWDRYVDEHSLMAYDKVLHPLRHIYEEALRSLTKPVVPILMTTRPIGEHDGTPPRDVRLNMLTLATCGRIGGIDFFPGDIGMDGEYMAEIDRAGNEIAVLEDFFLDGITPDNTIKITVLPEKELPDNARKLLFDKTYQLDDKLLICLFNYQPDKDAHVKISVLDPAEGEYCVYDPMDETMIPHPGSGGHWRENELKEGFSCSIPRYDAKFLVLKKLKTP